MKYKVGQKVTVYKPPPGCSCNVCVGLVGKVFIIEDVNVDNSCFLLTGYGWTPKTEIRPYKSIWELKKYYEKDRQ